MQYKLLVTFILSVFCSSLFGQKQQNLKDIKAMMKEAREPEILCMIIVSNKDTVKDSDLGLAWNKKEKIAEYRMAGRVIPVDSVFFYQDGDGYHAITHWKMANKNYTFDFARIVRGKAEIFVSNWDSRGSPSEFNPSVSNGKGQMVGLDPTKPIGYNSVNQHKVTSQYYIRPMNSLGTPVIIRYQNFKDLVSNNPAALKEFNAQFNGKDDPNNPITDWEKIKAVIDIYNQ